MLSLNIHFQLIYCLGVQSASVSDAGDCVHSLSEQGSLEGASFSIQ